MMFGDVLHFLAFTFSPIRHSHIACTIIEARLQPCNKVKTTPPTLPLTNRHETTSQLRLSIVVVSEDNSYVVPFFPCYIFIPKTPTAQVHKSVPQY